MNPVLKPALTNIPIEELPQVAAELGLPAFAAKQLVEWIYEKRAGSFAEMTSLSKEARAKLEEKYRIDALELSGTQISEDGTKKFLLRCDDGKEIETVLLLSDTKRRTVCVSSQVGCAMACDFCRTAKMGFKRHLTIGEIASQLRFAMRQSEDPVTNVVFMGMGEPLHNLDNVVYAANLMCNQKAFNLSKRRITVSTSGLVDKLREFVTRTEVKIAISLSATTDNLRDKLMPVNKRFPIEELMDFCREYSDNNRTRITFEYILIKGVNDRKEDAIRLAKLMRGVRCKINLIPMNPYKEVEYYPSDPETVEWWTEYLNGKKITATVRVNRGRDILAACGQLARGEVKMITPKVAVTVGDA